MAREKKAASVDIGSVEGPWDLPDGWRWVRLGDCGNWSSGGTPSAKVTHYYGGAIPWLTSGELNDSVVSNSEKTITEEGYANSSVKWLPPDTLLVAMYGATIGKAAITGFRCTTNQAIAACQPHDGFNVRYLHYFILSQRDQLRKLGQGGAQPNISQALLKDFPCPIPPLIEQQNIVAIIDALFAEIDEGEAALADARAGVETYRKALLKAAVTGELTADWQRENPPAESGEQLLERILRDRRARWEADPKNARKKYVEPAGPDTDGLPDLPKGWSWASITQVCDVNPSVGLPNDGNVSFVPMAAVEPESGIVSVVQQRPVAEVRTGFTRFASGDVLFAKITPCMENGKIAIVPPLPKSVGTGSTEFHVLRPFGTTAEYLWAFLVQPATRDNAARNMTGTAGQMRVPKSYLEALAIPIPPLAEQLEIVKTVGSIGIEIASKQRQLDAIKLSATSLRQSILAAAFRGELTV